ncbi:hypothetical protein AB0P21_31485 [Kribbella sp. NPDC056861]|uniref:STAS domain-containing protein n=1 Tax=Kribbella sp. NPDC056861 TaxID=3154857 RepID=UPI0034136CBF
MSKGGDHSRRSGYAFLLDIEVEQGDAGVTVVRLVGVLSIATVPRVRAALLKCLADRPTAVIVDLELLAVQHAVALNVFAVAARQAAVWSGAELLLVSGPGLEGRLKPRARVLGRFVRIYPSMAVAKASTRRPPLRRLALRLLPAGPSAAWLARRQVHEILAEWSCGGLDADAASIASELATHAIRCSDSEPILRLELRSDLLTVAVTYHQAPGVTKELEPLGLSIITALAKVNGTSPTHTGGTVDWCVLQADPTPNAEPPG